MELLIGLGIGILLVLLILLVLFAYRYAWKSNMKNIIFSKQGIIIQLILLTFTLSISVAYFYIIPKNEAELLEEYWQETVELLSEATEGYSNKTTGEENATLAAENYLSLMAFSRQGLIEQLEYEGYTNKEATIGVNNCDVDWDIQAELKAREYLDIMPFSKDGLVEQLEYEGFTRLQALHGANACYE